VRGLLLNEDLHDYIDYLLLKAVNPLNARIVSARNDIEANCNLTKGD
jgi:hypothetical protein